jgi:hypothetical protein
MFLVEEFRKDLGTVPKLFLRPVIAHWLALALRTLRLLSNVGKILGRRGMNLALGSAAVVVRAADSRNRR